MTAGLKKFAALCAFAALWICSAAPAAEVRAWLDRSSMQLGETVTLNVEVSGDTSAAQPDLTALAHDFDLLGTQSSTSVNIVNGQSSSKLLWAVGLQPKHEGTLTIPALTVAGQQTLPLTLMVQPQSAGGANGGDVYVEATVEPHAPYVQQQIRLNLKLYYALSLLDGNLADPQGDGLVVHKLGQDSSYNANVGGRNYHVVERHYALLAEKSGALTLSPIVFRGHVVEGSSMDIFFNRGREVSARTQPITLDVRPRPAASGNDVWLPARSLTLSATGIDKSTSARVGEPITLTLRVQAQGLGFEQLPELKLPTIAGVDVYPDKPSAQNRDDGEWVFGERERKFAIVPNRTGPLKLPAIDLSWWDTAHDRAETASVPALTIDVQPAAAVAEPSRSGTAAGAANPAGENAPSVSLPSAGIPGSERGMAEARTWRLIALSSLALWVAAVLAFLLVLRRPRRRPAATTDDGATSAPRKAFREACARGDLHAAANALLAWGRLRQPRLRNLGELAHLLTDSAQRAAIGELERSRYGAAPIAGTAAALQRAFTNGPALAEPRRPAGETGVLPELYPFRT